MAAHFGFTLPMLAIILWLDIDGDEVSNVGPIMERTRVKYALFNVIKKTNPQKWIGFFVN
ncbi:hypothetical protein [Peribacillus butanolivorans]|uniref:hypothetical protein n=1 Tax=Peribacillus butanolivorans TaxID=421767 RepID=UPI00167F5C01|nr:hypothetical protein [Peribacillus butanolivorans]QNU05811.1 hypothetical protein GM240_19145 [Peribacillus butanolivorans]